MSADTPPSPTPVAQEHLRQWHRAFGIALMDVFAEAPWRVELEQELALKSQLLYVAIIEAAGEGADAPLPPELPDGLDNLRAHNLLTYKSRHEALSVWTLDELTGHYVNYRKLRLDAQQQRHPTRAFGLYAVATRFPRALARAHPLQSTACDGVYDLPWGGHRVRVIVLNQIAQHPRNAPWELFASEQDRIRQGLEHYRARAPSPHQHGYWKLLEHLHLIFLREVPEMAYTMDDFIRDTDELVLEAAIKRDPDAILKRFDPEQRLRGLDPDAILERFDPEQRLKGLDPEQRLKGLDPDAIEAWLAKQRRGH